MIDASTVLVIFLMALSTYLTRITGYLLIKDKQLSNKTKYMMECAPGCVLISIIAPVFISDDVATLVGLAIAILATFRYGLLGTVFIAVITTGVLRYIGIENLF
ncbi:MULTISPECIES: AzlD family protein [Acinetobacter]|mgnify:CR=1 FL=1|uniref:AzlD family protein n=1 Tax=Acinetobacter TaxID=469 RepID=UPI0021CDA52F|nr:MULTISPECIES: AzlD family protein [Acinetobacter]MCU4568479.1 AzlD family protein [Acinetobacter radioresistens]WDE17644.1 AzlD family protein [Acinetobacter schindleri]